MQNLIFPLLIVVLAVPLFLSARKQKKMQAAQQDLQKSIASGDRVMTTSGLYGTVAGTADETIDIEIAPGVVTTWLRAAVREKVNVTDTTGTDAVDDTEPKAAEVNGTTLVTGKTPESDAELASQLEHGKKSS